MPSSGRRSSSGRAGPENGSACAVPFIPMPVPKPVCRTCLNNKRVRGQYEVCTTFLGRGMGMNITAQPAANPRRKNLDFSGSGSSRLLALRGGIPRSMGSLPEKFGVDDS